MGKVESGWREEKEGKKEEEEEEVTVQSDPAGAWQDVKLAEPEI